MVIPGLKIEPDSPVPVYRQIADGVKAAALDGRLAAGRRLPPTRDLARQLGVNRNTVIAAYDALAADGWVRGHTGKGTFLATPGQARAAAAPPDEADAMRPAETDESWAASFSRAVEGPGVGGLLSFYQLATATEGISFAGSYPAPDLLPVEPFARALDTAMRDCGAGLLTYGVTAGRPALRDWTVEWMRRRGSPVTADDLLVTNGAQQAIELVFHTFLERGDPVIIEEPTYTGALSVLSSLGARVVAVPMDEEGIRPDHLAHALERHRPGLMYLQPTFHNPTTRVMGEGRRREVLALAERFRCTVVEDDWAAELRLDGAELPTLHALDGGRHVIYLSTFSKKLMPGLRVGWVSAPRPVMERLVALKQIRDCGTSPLLQAALERFLASGGLDDHLQRSLPSYRERRDCLLQAMQRHFPEGMAWTRPQGGLFVWVTLPERVDAEGLFIAARQRGVIYNKGDRFHSTGAGAQHMRLTFSAASPEQIETGTAILGELIRERWPDGGEAARQTAGEAMPIL